MITCYFGVPGVGKTTLLAKFARKELKRIANGKSKYDRVYTNFECPDCYKITFKDLEEHKVYNGLILLDELMLDADNRNFKTFPLGIRDFLTLHRKLGVDIIYATQAYDKVDTKIRALTQDLWYMSKSVIPFLCEFTVAKRIYRTISITELNGELVMGYRFANILERFFVSNYKVVFRRFYYKFFDSFDEGHIKKRDLFESELWSKSEDENLIMRLNISELSQIMKEKGFSREQITEKVTSIFFKK